MTTLVCAATVYKSHSLIVSYISVHFTHVESNIFKSTSLNWHSTAYETVMILISYSCTFQ